jgi:hypothetical protein
MFKTFALATGLVAMAAAFTPVAATAAPALPQSRIANVADGGTLVQQVAHRHHRAYRAHHRVHVQHRHHRRIHYRGGRIVVGGGYCVSWRHSCASRFGWGTGGYYRCLARHGC